MDNRWPDQMAFPANGAAPAPYPGAAPGAPGYRAPQASQPLPASAAGYGAPARPPAVSAPISPDTTAYLQPVPGGQGQAPATAQPYGYPGQAQPQMPGAAGYGAGAPGATAGWQQPAGAMPGAAAGQRTYTFAEVLRRWNCPESYVYEQMQRGMPLRRQANGLYVITEHDLVGWEYMMAVVAAQDQPKRNGWAIGAIVSVALFVLIIVLFIVFYEPIAQAIESAVPNVHVMRWPEIAAMLPWS